MGKWLFMKIEEISASKMQCKNSFLGAKFKENLNTKEAKNEMDKDNEISTKMDETMSYLNALSDERKCDIAVDMDYDPKTKRGEISGEITDRTGKKPKRHVRVIIDSNNELNVIHHINQFKNDCSALIHS